MQLRQYLPKKDSSIRIVLSCILAISTWLYFAPNRIVTKQLHVPLCFYNRPHDKTITAPESVTVHIRGTRAELNAIDTDQLAVHIDASHLNSDPYLLQINSRSLFLPDRIQVVYYTPLNPIVQCKSIIN